MTSKEIDKLKKRVKKLEMKHTALVGKVSAFFRSLITHIEIESDFAAQLRKILNQLDAL